MKKILALLLALIMALSLCGCGKSENVKAVEAAIEAIGEVSLDSEDVIVSAENLFEQLTAEEQEKVENRILLTQAREAYEQAVLDAIPTKEEMLAQAEKFDAYAFAEKYGENQLSAKDTYMEKFFKMDGKVSEISEAGCELSVSSAGGYNFHVLFEMPTEELKDLKKGDFVTLVGQLAGLEDSRESIPGGGYMDFLNLKLTNGYCVENRGPNVTLDGIMGDKNTHLDMVDGRYPYNFNYQRDYYAGFAYFADGEHPEKYEGKKVRISGLIKQNNFGFYMENAKIIEMVD